MHPSHLNLKELLRAQCDNPYFLALAIRAQDKIDELEDDTDSLRLGYDELDSRSQDKIDNLEDELEELESKLEEANKTIERLTAQIESLEHNIWKIETRGPGWG